MSAINLPNPRTLSLPVVPPSIQDAAVKTYLENLRIELERAYTTHFDNDDTIRTKALSVDNKNTADGPVVADSSGKYPALDGSLITNLSSNASISPVTITGGSIVGITDLAVADGGTGASTATGAMDNLLPTQSGNDNKFLQTNGTHAGWTAVSAMTYADTRYAVMFHSHDVATSGTIVVTGFGFAPTSIICFAGMGTTAGLSVGVAAVNTGGAISATGTHESFDGFTGYPVYLRWGNNVAAYASVGSWMSDGFAFSWSGLNSPTGTATVYILGMR